MSWNLDDYVCSGWRVVVCSCFEYIVVVGSAMYIDSNVVVDKIYNEHCMKYSSDPICQIN